MIEYQCVCYTPEKSHVRLHSDRLQDEAAFVRRWTIQPLILYPDQHFENVKCVTNFKINTKYSTGFLVIFLKETRPENI